MDYIEDDINSIEKSLDRRGLQAFLVKHKNRMSRKPTEAELKMAEILDSLPIRYVPQKIHFRKGVRRIYDFFIRKHLIIVEVDGSYHDESKDKKRDAETQRLFPKYRTVRFKNEEVLNDPDLCKEIICRYIGFSP